MTYETPNYKKNWRSRRVNNKQRARGFGLTEKMFYYYHKIKKAVEEVRQEQGYYQSAGRTGGGSSNHAFVSDPTAILAMKHAASLPTVIINADKLSEEIIERPEDWLAVVEQTLKYFEDEPLVSDVLRRRFFNNETRICTCIELNINDDKYYRLRDVGIGYARECAIQLGLIKVFDFSKLASARAEK